MSATLTAISLSVMVFVGAAEDKAEALKKAKRSLEVAYTVNDAGKMAEAIHEIGAVDDAEAVKLLTVLEMIDPKVAYDALNETLASLKNEEAIKALADAYKKAARSRKWQRQILIIDALEKHVDTHAKEVFTSAAKDSNSKVRLAAVRAMAKGKPSTTHVDALIEVLRVTEKIHDKGLPYIEARETLKRMTGQLHGGHKDWVAWWKGASEGFDFAAVKPPAKAEDDKGDAQNLMYYQVPVVSRRMVFIIDTSGSMTAPMKVMTKSIGGVGEQKEMQRIDRAKQELTELLQKLPAYTGFNVMEFNSNTRSWKKNLVPSSKGTVGSAMMFTKRLKPSGLTAANAALTEALTNSVDADTIYLLSDGAPTDGSPIDIMANVEKLNRYLRMTIHTVSFGTSGRFLLKPLSDAHHGKYQEIVDQ